jgi:hypothetical protein
MMRDYVKSARLTFETPSSYFKRLPPRRVPDARCDIRLDVAAFG